MPGFKLGCKTCRDRHAKCVVPQLRSVGDSKWPACQTCQRAGIECHWNSRFRFCHDFNPSIQSMKTLEDTFSLTPRAEYFSGNQEWLEIPKNLSFISESAQLELDAGLVEDFTKVSPIESAESRGKLNSLLAQVSHRYASRELSQESSVELGPSLTLETPCINGCLCLEQLPSTLERIPTDRSAISPLTSTKSYSPTETGDPHSSHSLRASYSSSHPSEPLSKWPLKNQEEAHLMRHFVDKLSPMLDLCDSNRHFANIATRRAMSNSTLLNAIFALSARHLSRITEYDPYIADRYHQRCIQALIPVLGNPSALMDSALFAATVILRMFEELDVALAGGDAQGHLRGAQILIGAQKYSEIRSGLGQAAFWVALRQEIHIALTHQRPILGSLEQCNIDLSFSPAIDVVWAYRAIVHCASILRFCFGKGTEQYVDQWQQLVDYNLEWSRRKPRSFEPLFCNDDLENSCASGFPAIYYLGEPHVTAAQHHTLSRILLAVYSPHVPRIGLDSQRLSDKTNEDIKGYIVELCGTALSNQNTVPAFHAACIGISMCGTRFKNRLDQEKLLSVLIKTEREHAWPTKYAQERLREAWGWDKRD